MFPSVYVVFQGNAKSGETFDKSICGRPSTVSPSRTTNYTPCRARSRAKICSSFKMPPVFDTRNRQRAMFRR